MKPESMLIRLNSCEFSYGDLTYPRSLYQADTTDARGLFVGLQLKFAVSVNWA
jgi:hypothetical protein